MASNMDAVNAVTTGLVTMLDGLGFAGGCGDGETPGQTFPYVIVYLVAVDAPRTDWTEHERTVDITFQIRAVAKTRAQRDRVFARAMTSAVEDDFDPVDVGDSMEAAVWDRENLGVVPIEVDTDAVTAAAGQVRFRCSVVASQP